MDMRTLKWIEERRVAILNLVEKIQKETVNANH